MFKKYFLVLAVGSTMIVSQGCEQQGQSESESAAASSDVELVTLEQRFSYAVGADLAENLKQNGITLETDLMVQAINDVNSGAELRLSREERQQANNDIRRQLQEKRLADQEAAGEKNKAEGEAFLAENAQNEGVVSLDSGLQYKVITEGDGAKPAETDTVTVHYRGTLLDGTEFDSSYKRGTPASFPLTSVIAGWTEGLQLMNVGSKWELYIPASLAYGAGGTGGIPPNSTLKFEVELLGIETPQGE